MINNSVMNALKKLKRARYRHPFKASISLTHFIDKRDYFSHSMQMHKGIGKLIPLSEIISDFISSFVRISVSRYYKKEQLCLLTEAYTQALSGNKNDHLFTGILYPASLRKDRYKPNNLSVFYRYYEKDSKKPRPQGFSKIKLFSTFANIFSDVPMYVFIDNSSEEAGTTLKLIAPSISIFQNKLGNAKNLLKAMELATTLEDDKIIYFVEDDYVHRPRSAELILEAFNSGLEFDYLTLYDHPDKYSDCYNRHVKGGGEDSKVFFTGSVHWKETGSTTMTFAATAATIKKDIGVFKRFSKGSTPRDFKIFEYLRKVRNRRIISSIPGYASHCDGDAIAPLFPSSLEGY